MRVLVLALMWQAAAGAAPLFEVVHGDASTVDGGLSRGVAFGDADGDGDADLLVANTINYPEFLYRNDDGRFVQVMETAPSLAGGFSEGVSWADFDNDGDLDVFVVRSNGPNTLYRNDGAWHFVAHEAGALSSDDSPSSMSCWADVDRDGWPDVFVVNRRGEDDALYRNVDGATFERITQSAPGSNGGDGRSCAFGDLDNDGDADLYVGNFIDTSTEPESKQRNFLYVNDGDFRFSERKRGHAVEFRALTYGASWADVDNDGDLDLFVTNIGIGDGNQLYFNDGRGGLALGEAGLDATNDAPSKGHTWGDFDLDGDLDLAVANGTEGSDQMANFLYLNDGSAHFVRVEGDPFARDADISAGIAWADIDRDGDLDLYVANWGDGDEDNALYRNIGDGCWLSIRLIGGPSNRMGLGAKATVTIRRGDRPVRLSRWLYPQTGYASQNEPVLHFGLGRAQRIETLLIDWPSGRRDAFTGLAADRHWLIEEGRPVAGAEAH